MLLKKITKLSQVLALMAIVLGVGAFYQAEAAAAGNMAAAFDDDRKKNRGQRGDQRGKRGGERGRDSQRDSDRESRRQQAQSDQNSRRQQRSSDNESRRQQQRSDENGRRQQRQSDNGSRRQQEWSDRNSRRQQWESDRRSRQQYESDRGNRSRDQNRDRGDRRRNNDRPVVYVAPGTIFGQRWNGRPVSGFDNRRLVRDQQRFIKEQNKAQRRYQQDQRRAARTQYNRYPAPVYQYDNNYYANQPDYNGGSSWKSQILPVLIANIFGGGNSFGGDSIAFNGGYPVERYSRANVNPYSYQDRQPAYAYEPSYNNYGYDEEYAYNQPGIDASRILGSLPIAEIIQQYTGENEFVSGLIGSFLTQGYDQGIVAGQNARQYGYSEDQYNNPYTYQNGVCDPYSASVGENRRYLSEGYEQGYRDALAGNESYDQGTSGNADLIGVLLNSVLSGV